MKKRLLAALFAAMAMLAGCAGETAPPDFARPDSMVYSTEEEADFPDIRWDFADKYYDIPDAIRAIPGAEGESWTPSGGETDSLYDFLHHFGLLIDAVQAEAHLPAVPESSGELSKFDCEALCWGDPVQINHRFVSNYAAVSESGNIATIFWLAAHTAADYAEIGLTVADVEWAVVECEKLGLPEIADTVAQARENYESYQAEAGPMVYDTRESFTHSLEGGPSWIYNDVYNTIDGMLIYYIGSGRFDDWVKNTDTPHNMQTCVEEFDLTADEVVAALTAGGEPLEISGLTEAEIDILCSGDQAAINRAFASDFAAVSESGSIYTIFWLGTHTADDYRAAGLSAEAVRAAADSCMELGIESVNPYIAAAKSALGGMDGS